MIQREVADRIISNKESILSLSVKFYGEAKKISNVSKKMFSPVPKVDSAIITIVNIKKRDKDLEKKFFDLIKSAFSHKRKIVLNNL